MPRIDREAEIGQLATVYGAPMRQHCALEVDKATHDYWAREHNRRKYGEVVLFIQRPNGNLILHTKSFYPAGTFRVPSGGIRKGESLLDAVRRESGEETGLRVVVQRFLAVVEFEFHWQGRTLSLPSHLFLAREVGGQLQARDAHENITGFSEVTPAELESVAQRLENVPADWRDWGRFRAVPHRLAAALLSGV